MSINRDTITTSHTQGLNDINASQSSDKSPVSNAIQGSTNISDAMKSPDGGTSLNKTNPNSRTVATLQNTYFFNETEAKQIAAFSEAVNEHKSEGLHVDIHPGFLTKIKSLCAKILKFFGNESKAVKLQKEGIEVFNDLKGILLDSRNKEFTLSFINNNKNNPDALKGFAKVLGLKGEEATPERLEAFVNVNYFSKLESLNEKIMFFREVFEQCTNEPGVHPNNNKKLKAVLSELESRISENGSNSYDKHFHSLFKLGTLMPKETVLEKYNEWALTNRLQEKMPDNGPKFEKSEDILTWLKDNNASNLLMDAKLLKDFPKVKTFLEKEVLPLTKEEVLNGLKKNLERPVKNLVKDFHKDANQIQIFKDLARGFSLKILGTDVDINLPEEGSLPEGVTSKEEWAFLKFQDAIKDLPKDKQDKIREFCKNFSTQGLLANEHPRVSGLGSIGQSLVFEVDISNPNFHVIASIKNNKIFQPYSGVIENSMIATNTTTPVFKFEFDYHPEDGHASNVNMIAYEGQTVDIPYVYVEGEEIYL